MRELKIEHKVYIARRPGDVFEALTDGQVWSKWFTSECVIGHTVEEEVRFVWEYFGVDGVSVNDHGQIVKFDYPGKFAFTWNPGKSETVVEFSLSARGEGTVVALEETGYTQDEEDIAAFKSCSVGWGEALTLFKFYLEHGITYGPIPK